MSALSSGRLRRRRRLAACLFLAAACTPATRSPTEPTPARFYAGRDFGSESQFNPLSEIINDGFDIVRAQAPVDRKVFSRDYAGAFRNVIESVAHADRTFRYYGIARAARNEWLPLTLSDNAGGGAWIPNYEFHLFGSGMVSVRMEEWYAQHGSSHPRVAAISTMITAHLINEVVENNLQRSPNEDAVTDLLIFDPLGMVLWRIDAVQRFFSGPVETTNWPGQPSVDVNSRTLQNTGQQIMVRGRIPGTERWRLIYIMGMSSELGLSFGRAHEGSWSAAIGPYVVSNPVVDTLRGAKTADLRLNAGVFYDRDGSLLFSAIYSPRSDLARLNVNVYPGVLRVGDVRPGLWIQTAPKGGVRFGIASRWGVGIGHGPER